MFILFLLKWLLVPILLLGLAASSIYLSFCAPAAAELKISRVSAAVLGIVISLLATFVAPLDFGEDGEFIPPSSFWVGGIGFVAGVFMVSTLSKFARTRASAVLIFALSMAGFSCSILYFTQSPVRGTLIVASLAFLAGVLFFTAFFPTSFKRILEPFDRL